MIRYGDLVGVWALMLALLALSVTAAVFAPADLAFVISFGSAIAIAALTMAVFMGLKAANGLIRLFALGSLLWLGFLLSLTLADTLAR